MEVIESGAEKTMGIIFNRKDAAVSAFLKAYPQHSKFNALYSDTMIGLPIQKITTAKPLQNSAPVYSYVFAYGTPFSCRTAEYM